MNCRLMAIATAATLLASAAFADPPKAGAPAPTMGHTASKQVILASAENVQSPAPDQGQDGRDVPDGARADDEASARHQAAATSSSSST